MNLDYIECEEPLYPEGWIHEDDIPDLEFSRGMIESIINAIYETGDIENLEDCLEELAGGFELKIPNKQSLLVRGE